MRGRYVALAALALSAGLAGGVWLERQRMETAAGAESGPKVLYWVAPMDPNFRKEGPGKSPMGMDLIPVYEGDEPTGDPEEVQLSAAEINAIGVRTAVARVDEIARRIETVGFVGYDEHATSHIHMRVEGWIERLKVRAVGDRVAVGELLFELYAPEITIASSELMRATRRRDATEVTVARRKLRNFGVSPAQIDEMAVADAPAQNIRVYAPQDGVVIGLAGADGMYLKPETRAMSLSDLSSVWLLVDVFERDVGRLTADMTAEARFEHLPGRVFEGAVDYIFPELDPETRTLRVRLRFENSEGLLKPNMFATVSLKPSTTREVITVPSEAVIRTGRAERVILRTGDGVFRPRLITTGLRGGFGEGSRTEIVQGLEPGDEVVASAQFLIDSESALNAGLLRFAPSEAEPAEAKGVLVALDRQRRRAVIRHEAIPALDWPALETGFAIRSNVMLEDLAPGDAVEFTAFRGADGLLALSALGGDDGIDATGTGVVHAVTPDGKLTLSHDPIPALGWPSMRMDLDVAGLDPSTVPLERPVEFDLAKSDDGLFTIIAVRGEGEPPLQPAEEPPATPPMIVEGTVHSVDAETRMAKATHGPLAAIGMPGMTMDFPLGQDLDPASVVAGEATLSIVSDPEKGLVLAAVEPKAAPMKVMGTVNSVDASSGMANVTHGPMAEIGMPGMTMDFPLGPDLDPAGLPLGAEVSLLIEKGSDFSLTLVGV
ncbi:MAG: efflux RND transporter periplasmic adaptor subunit, partial [Pseudomonadota bacterium]